MKSGSSKLAPDSRFDGRAGIAADAGSGRVDQGHQHFITAIVMAGASVTELTDTLLHALLAELRCRFCAFRARDGGRLVAGQELEGAAERGRGVFAGDTQCQFRSGAEIVLMGEHDAGFEFSVQGLAHQRVAIGISIGERLLGRSNQLLDHRGDIRWRGAPKPLSFDGKLEGAEMAAAFQPDGAEKAVEAAESAVSGCLQVHPVIGLVTGFHDQMEPAERRLAGPGDRVLFPARFEMIGHLAFAKPPVAKPARCRSKFIIHGSSKYRKGQAGSSPFHRASVAGQPKSLAASLARTYFARMIDPSRRGTCRVSLVALALASLVLHLDATGRAENWPQWRGPYFNGSTTEKDLPTQWSKTQERGLDRAAAG